MSQNAVSVAVQIARAFNEWDPYLPVAWRRLLVRSNYCEVFDSTSNIINWNVKAGILLENVLNLRFDCSPNVWGHLWDMVDKLHYCLYFIKSGALPSFYCQSSNTSVWRAGIWRFANFNKIALEDTRSLPIIYRILRPVGAIIPRGRGPDRLHPCLSVLQLRLLVNYVTQPQV